MELFVAGPYDIATWPTSSALATASERGILLERENAA